MPSLTADQHYLRYQYAGPEKLRIRQEAHRLYSESDIDFFAWVLDHARLEPGQLVLDVGCGPGAYHPALAKRGVRTFGIDFSWGMVRTVRQQALERGWLVWAACGDAARLPLADQVCDRVLANHMLYHVPDIPAALRELRRVTRPGGLVVMATNAADNGRRLWDLHAEAARELGFTPGEAMSRRFTLDDLDLVRSVFPGAQVYAIEDAFLFPDAEAALRYYLSGMVDMLADLPPDGVHRGLLGEAVRRRIEAIVAAEGVFRVLKGSGCFVAEV